MQPMFDHNLDNSSSKQCVNQTQMNVEKKGNSQKIPISSSNFDESLVLRELDNDDAEDESDVFSLFHWSKGSQNVDNIEFARAKFHNDARRFSLIKRTSTRGKEVIALLEKSKTAALNQNGEIKNKAKLLSKSAPVFHLSSSEFSFLESFSHLDYSHRAPRRRSSLTDIRDYFSPGDSMCLESPTVSGYTVRELKHYISGLTRRDEVTPNQAMNESTDGCNNSENLYSSNHNNTQDNPILPSRIYRIPRRRSSISEGCNVGQSLTESVSQALKLLEHRNEHKRTKACNKKHRHSGKKIVASNKDHDQKHSKTQELQDLKSGKQGNLESPRPLHHSNRAPRRRSSFSEGCYKLKQIELEDLTSKRVDPPSESQLQSPRSKAKSHKGSKHDRRSKKSVPNSIEEVGDTGVSQSMTSSNPHSKGKHGNRSLSNSLSSESQSDSSRRPARRRSSFSAGCKNIPSLESWMIDSSTDPRNGSNDNSRRGTTARFENDGSSLAAERTGSCQSDDIGNYLSEEDVVTVLRRNTLDKHSKQSQHNRSRHHHHDATKKSHILDCDKGKMVIDESRVRRHKEGHVLRSHRHRSISPKGRT